MASCHCSCGQGCRILLSSSISSDDDASPGELGPWAKCTSQNTSVIIIVKLVKQLLKQLFLMWLTSLLMTPFIFHFVITSSSSIETANAAILINQPINSTDDSTHSPLDLPVTSASTVTHQLTNPSLTSNENAKLLAFTDVITSDAGKVPPRAAAAAAPQASPYFSPPPASPSSSSSSSQGSTGQIDCMIDAKKGFSNPSNVYQCSALQKCCLEHAKPSCCGSKAVTQIM